MSTSIAPSHLPECKNCKELIPHITTDSSCFPDALLCSPLCSPASRVCRAHAKQLLNTSTCVHVLYQKLTQTHANAHAPLIHTEKFLCGIQSQCSWLESLSTASDVTSACSVSCSSPAPFLFPTLFHQLNPSFDTSEGVPHTHVTSPPPPPVLSSWLSIESTHHRLKVVYFVELTLWCLHHLEVCKWYWVEGLIFMVESEKSSETFFFFSLVLRGGQTNIPLWMAGEEEEEKRGWRHHLCTCVFVRLWMVDWKVQGEGLPLLVTP